MKFWIYKHQHKAETYINALLCAGYELSPNRPDFVLIDHDVGRNGQEFRPQIEKHAREGAAIFMYPHAARPMIQWDGMYPLFTDHVKGSFVIAPGHTEVMRRYGYPLPTWEVGWSYCRFRPFKGVPKVKLILFCPSHPHGNGWLSEMDQQINIDTFNALLKLKGVHIIVRYLRDLRAQGLWVQRGVQYFQGKPDGSTRQIDYVDLVVAHQTPAYLAIARGKPTIMCGDRCVPHSGNSEESFRFVTSYENYREYLEYPYDVADGHLTDQIEEARRSDEKIRDWKARFLGKPFDPDYLVRVIEEQLKNGA
mgnify:CR=1 FL=1